MKSEKTNEILEKMIDDGYHHYLKGSFLDAELIYKTALLVAEQANVRVHKALGTVLYLLGDLYFERHDYGQAEWFYTQSLMSYQHLPACDIDFCIVLKRISEIYRIQSKAGQANDVANHCRSMMQPTINLLEKTYLQAAERRAS